MSNKLNCININDYLNDTIFVCIEYNHFWWTERVSGAANVSIIWHPHPAIWINLHALNKLKSRTFSNLLHFPWRKWSVWEEQFEHACYFSVLLWTITYGVGIKDKFHVLLYLMKKYVFTFINIILEFVSVTVDYLLHWYFSEAICFSDIILPATKWKDRVSINWIQSN